MIPPAPAYLGLNLFLKGTQILPKNGAGKREKSRELLRLRNEMRPLQEYNHKDPTGPDILTPRPFIIDLIDCITSKNDPTPRKGSKMRALMPTKRSTNLNPIGKENANSDSPRKWSSTLSRQYSTVAQIDTSRRKSVAKTNELTRRHVSCGPRLLTASPPDDTVKPEAEINNNNNTSSNPNEIKPPENADLACVGSKYCGDTEAIVPVPPSNGNTSRKQSLETPRLFPNKPKLKPLNVVNSINTNKCIQSNNSSTAGNKSSAKFLSANNREYRKYVNHLQMSKLQPNAVNDGYCSHFFAVGLSLRAWRSKYNQMLKSQNDKVDFAQSYGPLNSSRKSKKLEPK